MLGWFSRKIEKLAFIEFKTASGIHNDHRYSGTPTGWAHGWCFLFAENTWIQHPKRGMLTNRGGKIMTDQPQRWWFRTFDFPASLAPDHFPGAPTKFLLEIHHFFQKCQGDWKTMQQKQAQTAQKTAKKQTVTTSAIIGVLLFSAMILHFFRIYIYIYVVFFLSFCECQFQLHSQSLCILSPHFVLRCVFFWGGAIWKKHSGKNRGAQSQAMVPSPHIRSSISHDPFWLWLHRRTAPRSSLKKWDSSNGWADGRLWLSGGAPGPSSWLAKLPKSSLGSLLGFCWLWLWPLVSWMGEHEPTTHT